MSFYRCRSCNRELINDRPVPAPQPCGDCLKIWQLADQSSLQAVMEREIKESREAKKDKRPRRSILAEPSRSLRYERVRHRGGGYLEGYD